MIGMSVPASTVQSRTGATHPMTASGQGPWTHCTGSGARSWTVRRGSGSARLRGPLPAALRPDLGRPAASVAGPRRAWEYGRIPAPARRRRVLRRRVLRPPSLRRATQRWLRPRRPAASVAAELLLRTGRAWEYGRIPAPARRRRVLRRRVLRPPSLRRATPPRWGRCAGRTARRSSGSSFE